MLHHQALRHPGFYPSPAMNQSTAYSSAPQHLGSTAATPAAPENGNSITGFAEAVNTVFQSVDQSRVASGILEEHGLQFIDRPPSLAPTASPPPIRRRPLLCFLSPPFPFRL